jgi:hypothetical protein
MFTNRGGIPGRTFGLFMEKWEQDRIAGLVRKDLAIVQT